MIRVGLAFALCDQIGQKRALRFHPVGAAHVSQRGRIALRHPSRKVRTVRDSGDGATDQVVDVTLREKTRALKLAARAGMRLDGLDVATSEETLARLDEWKVANRRAQLADKDNGDPT